MEVKTLFAKGEIVEATTSAQGLSEGRLYKIIETDVLSLGFGKYVQYLLQTVGPKSKSEQIPFWVSNLQVLVK